VLDRLAEEALAQADVAEVDASERVRRLAHQHLPKCEQRIVILLVQHHRPAEKGLGLRLAGRQLQRSRERRFRGAVIAP
jgi:hypothetical protein